jgi:hypothetical protein
VAQHGGLTAKIVDLAQTRRSRRSAAAWVDGKPVHFAVVGAEAIGASFTGTGQPENGWDRWLIARGAIDPARLRRQLRAICSSPIPLDVAKFDYGKDIAKYADACAPECHRSQPGLFVPAAS